MTEVELEADKPPKSIFMQVGYDTDSNNIRKHYRRYFLDELENCGNINGKKLFTSPFLSEKIQRAKIKTKSGILGRLFDQFRDKRGETNEKFDVGQFKGIVRCYPERDLRVYEMKTREKIA